VLDEREGGAAGPSTILPSNLFIPHDARAGRLSMIPLRRGKGVRFFGRSAAQRGERSKWRDHFLNFFLSATRVGPGYPLYIARVDRPWKQNWKLAQTTGGASAVLPSRNRRVRRTRTPTSAALAPRHEENAVPRQGYFAPDFYRNAAAILIAGVIEAQRTRAVRDCLPIDFTTRKANADYRPPAGNSTPSIRMIAIRQLSGRLTAGGAPMVANEQLT